MPQDAAKLKALGLKLELFLRTSQGYFNYKAKILVKSIKNFPCWILKNLL
jgi:hypothetical protein